ncbi:HtaA domain-containing protein [Microbacterium sp. NPDC077184]|uniref:HtaA domain-containing protein n=1 Tax=Microbacterium sp. NPDC077184 TaxID=3154764 RepID=UPI00342FE140
MLPETVPPLAARAKIALAVLLSALLVLAGARTAPTARALVDGAVVAPSVTAASADGITVQVQASGLGAATSAYAALIEKGTEANLTGAGGYAAFAMPFPVVADGATTFALTAAAAGLDRTKTYEVLIWQIHSPANATTIYARADVAISTADWDAVFPPAPEPEPEPDPTPAPTSEPTDEPTPEPTPTPAPEPTEEPTPTPAPAPMVTVSVTEGLDRDGQTVTVTGSGFVADPPATNGARPPLAGVFAGAYVVFGKFLDDWRPSAGAPSSARTVIGQKWGVNEAQFGGSVNAANGGFVIAADGSFEIELTVSASEANDLRAGNYGIYTYPGSGATYAAFETSTPLTFVEPAPVFEPEIEVFRADGTTPVGASLVAPGEEVVVRGSGFDPAANVGGRGVPIPATLPQGSYIVFGSFAPAWQPSAGAPSTNRKVGAQGWILADDVLNQVPPMYQGAVRAQWVPLADDGTFEARLTVSEIVDGPAGGRTGVYTYGAGGVANSAQELFVPISVGVDPEPEPEPTPEPTPTPTPKPTPTTPPVLTPTGPESPVGAGSLRWGISSSFVSYVTGPIAGGSVAATGGATRANGAFQFGQAAGSTYSTASGTGTVSYSGAVRVLGHSGVLDVTIAAPQVRITSSTSADLYVTSGGSQVRFATLNLTAGTRSTGSGTVTYSGVPATITADGVARVLQGFSTTLDPVTFTVGVPAPAPAGSTGTVVAAAPEPQARVLPTERGIASTLARTAALGACVVDAATLAWGFKESFRTYIEGIAAGGWELDGVAYDYPDFTWTGGTGSVDAETRAGLVGFGGSIRFTGHDGALDTTLTDARIELAGDRGYVVFDVSGTTQDGAPVAQAGVRLAEFALPDLEVTDDGLLLDALPATLTDAGATAFGTYPAGEQLDPVSAVLPISADCDLAAGDAAAVVEDETEPTPAGPEAQSATTAASDAAPAVWPWAVGGFVVLAALAGAGVWVIVARRRSA